MGCLQRNLRGKKGTFSSRPLKKKGRRTPDHRLIYTTRKKERINMKRIWYQPWYNSLWLWRWLPLRLSKRQSLSTTTLLFRTTFIRTIILNLSFAVQAGDHLRSRIILGHFGEHLRYCTVLSHHKAPFGSFGCHRCTTKLRTWCPGTVPEYGTRSALI